MTWQAPPHHTETGLAITFAQRVSRLDLTPDVAEHFASLIAIEPTSACSAWWARSSLKKGYRALFVRDVHSLCCDCDACLSGEEPQ